MLKYFLWFCGLILLFGKVNAQEKQIQGIVFDKATNERIARVFLSNLRTKANTFNNIKGEFNITVQLNDVLVFSKSGYFNDTVKVTAYQTLPVYLRRSSIALREVTIKDTALSAEKQLEATKREYNRAYGALANKDVLTTSGINGAGIGIDAIWNMLSRSGRNATKLRGIIQRDYEAKVVDNRFNPLVVGRITGLKGEQLGNFMTRYRPDYYQVLLMSDYDFISYIKSCYNRFRRNPTAYFLPPLAP
jgi:hypothetical protein